MLCPKCMQREANVFFTKIVNGKKEEIKLCEQCAKGMGLLSQNGIMVEMSDFISDFIGKGFQARPLTSRLECPVCHTTIEQFARTSKFGCGECYNAFAPHLDSFMKEIQGTTAHTGKLPSRTKTEIFEKRRLDELKQQLTKAISEERFEDAAKLRDEIKELSQHSDNDNKKDGDK